MGEGDAAGTVTKLPWKASVAGAAEGQWRRPGLKGEREAVAES